MAAISTAYPFPSTAAVPACLPNGPSHSGRLTARALQSSPRKSTALMFSTVNRGNFIKSNRGKDFFLPCSCSGSIKNENSDATTSREGAEAEKYEKKVLNGQPAMPSAAESPRIRPLSDDEREKRRRMEDELKDSRTFIDYLAPRPLRRIYFASGAVSCTVAFVVSLTKVVTEPSLQLAEGGIANVGINLAGAVLFGALFIWEGKQKEERVIQRKEIREAQIRLGDREVFVTPEGEKMSRLKPVDDEWIIRRLDRWGKQDLLPQVGPKKGAILQKLVRERQPQLIVEVGSFTGYSAIKMAQAMPRGSRVISFELDFKWLLVAKRFVWQAKMADRVDVQWGDATKALPSVDAPIDFLFLDAKPWEYLSYLKAAEPLLSPGAIVVADNAGVFSKSLDAYLEYVRTSPLYHSDYVESTLEYRDDVPDGLEISVYKGSS